MTASRPQFRHSPDYWVTQKGPSVQVAISPAAIGWEAVRRFAESAMELLDGRFSTGAHHFGWIHCLWAGIRLWSCMQSDRLMRTA